MSEYKNPFVYLLKEHRYFYLGYMQIGYRFNYSLEKEFFNLNGIFLGN